MCPLCGPCRAQGDQCFPCPAPAERTAHGLADGEEVDDALKTKVDPSQ